MPRAIPLLRAIGAGVVLGAAVAFPVRAQFMVPPAPAAYALRGVTLVRADGARTDSVTIVVRGDRIEALGPGIEIPADAEVLAGDSLYVYPGLIDGDGKAAFKFPEPDIDRNDVQPWDPPRALQGFTPHRRVVDALSATGAAFRAQRAKGIVAAAAQPSGPVMPGRGVVLLFRNSATSPEALVLVPVLGPVFTLQGARGVYPGTLFAVTAFIRQAFQDAEHQQLLLAAYDRDPHGLPTPRWDPDYEVLRAAAAKTYPVFCAAETREDIELVLELADEFGFQPVIVGGSEAWRLADELARRKVPVLVSLDFPPPKQWQPPADTSQLQTPLDAGAEREQRDLEARYRNAGKLVAAGVRVALTSGGGDADLLAGARKAIAYGLSDQQALAALTSVPADLFGVGALPRIEPGLPATFIVTTGPLFSEKTRVPYTFVEGELQRASARKVAPGGEAPSVDVTGAWEISIGAQGQAVGGTMSLTQEGAEFHGTMALDMGNASVQSGTVSGNKVTFVIVISMGGQTMEADVTGTVEGDAITGSGSGPMGDFTYTATRSTPPNHGEAR